MQKQKQPDHGITSNRQKAARDILQAAFLFFFVQYVRCCHDADKALMSELRCKAQDVAALTFCAATLRKRLAARPDESSVSQAFPVDCLPLPCADLVRVQLVLRCDLPHSLVAT